MKNYYDVLGVSEDASNEQIKKAFKEIAKKENIDFVGTPTTNGLPIPVSYTHLTLPTILLV